MYNMREIEPKNKGGTDANVTRRISDNSDCDDDELDNKMTNTTLHGIQY
jgi:hypothetical protein